MDKQHEGLGPLLAVDTCRFGHPPASDGKTTWSARGSVLSTASHHVKLLKNQTSLGGNLPIVGCTNDAVWPQANKLMTATRSLNDRSLKGWLPHPCAGVE